MSRAVERILARLVPRRWRESIAGDLEEDRRAREAAGRRAGAGWMLRHGGGIVLRLLIEETRRGTWDRESAASGSARRFDASAWTADARYALRVLMRAPGFTAVSIATLALSIGLSTAVFSLAHGVLMRPLPFERSERIVRIAEFDGSQAPPVSGGAVSDTLIGMLAQGTRSFAAVSHVAVAGRPVRLPGGAVLVSGAEVGSQFFSVFPARPVAGRLFAASDGAPSAPPVVALSEAFWRASLDADPGVIGRALLVQDVMREVVGIVPAAFQYPAGDIALWFPGRHAWPEPGPRRFRISLPAVGRLAPEVTIEEARAETDMLARRVAALEAERSGEPRPPTVVRVRGLAADIGAPARPALLMMAAAVACVLLIAAVNLAGLLLARAAGRQRELGVRAALGASRWRLLRPMLIESLWLGVPGGALGVLLAAVFLDAAPLLTGTDFPRAGEIALDARAGAIAVVATSAVVLLCGLGPAFFARQGVIRESLAASPVRIGAIAHAPASRIRELLIVGQIALAVALLAAAGLLGRSFLTFVGVDTGFRPDGVLTFQIALPNDIWQHGDRQQQYYDELLARLRADARVSSAGFSTYMPMHRTRSFGPVTIEGWPEPADPASRPQTHFEVISEDYLRAIGIRLAAGRGFTRADTEDTEAVALVNEEFAWRYLRDGSVIGRRLQWGRTWHRVVGIVASKRHEGYSGEPRPELYVPLRQTAPVFASAAGGAAGFVIRTDGDPRALTPFVREQARAIDAASPVYNVMTLEDRLWQLSARPRFYATVVGSFAGLAMLTTLIGVFGVMSHAVQRRRREIGVRRALGARDAQIVRLVVSHGGALIAAGLACGAGFAWAGSGLLRGLVIGVGVGDPVTIAGVGAIVAVVGVAASYVPARRALAVEPVDVLKSE
jgi:predicted permease